MNSIEFEQLFSSTFGDINKDTLSGIGTNRSRFELAGVRSSENIKAIADLFFYLTRGFQRNYNAST